MINEHMCKIFYFYAQTFAYLNMGLNARKPVFGAGQTDQHHCYLLFGMYHI